MAGDADYGNVVLLLHGDSTFADTSPTPKTVTAVNAVISSAQSRFGGASMYFDGTGDYLTIPDSADWDFGTADFTIEKWVWFTSHTTVMALASNYLNSGTGWSLQRRSDTNTIRFGNGDTALLDVSWTPTDGQWYHLAVSRSGTSLRAFVDGAQVGSTATNSTNITGSTSLLSIGALYSGSYVQPFSGYIDDLRITKGVARYTSNFSGSLPSAAFLDYAGQVSGIVRDSTNALCARTVRAYNRSTGALVASTTSNGTTGAYTLNCSALGEVSVIALDDVAGTTENDLVLRVTPA